ncbi:MAG TPA: MXAN_2562 family outer membrane beta-barrel protein [Anaeromyxobacter sp.]
MKHAVVAALLAVLATSARAESPRWGSFDVSAGTYRPDIDAEFTGTTTPFKDAFGTGRSWLFRAGASRALFTSYGALEVGVQAGYLVANGHAVKLDGTRSEDTTSLKIVPTSLTLTYRFDVLAERLNIPLAPYGRVALDRFNWWVTDGDGGTVKRGATNGWSVAAGLCLLLDFFDPTLAREMDADSGVNHTYVFFEARKTTVDDFGSKSSWNLSDAKIGFSGGLLFVF